MDCFLVDVYQSFLTWAGKLVEEPETHQHDHDNDHDDDLSVYEELWGRPPSIKIRSSFEQITRECIKVPPFWSMVWTSGVQESATQKAPVQYRLGDQWVALKCDKARRVEEHSTKIRMGKCEYESNQHYTYI